MCIEVNHIISALVITSIIFFPFLKVTGKVGCVNVHVYLRELANVFREKEVEKVVEPSALKKCIGRKAQRFAGNQQEVRFNTFLAGNAH